MAPPSTRTLRQPKCGIIQAARNPPKAAPNGNPQNMALVMVARRRSGQNSLTSVMALGMAAPSPSPVTKRSTTNSVRSPEKPEAEQARPKIATAPIRTLRRPKRSRQGSRRQGAEREAEQGRAQDGRQRGPFDTPLGHQRWCDVADGGGVETVHEHDAEAKSENPPLKG